MGWGLSHQLKTINLCPTLEWGDTTATFSSGVPRILHSVPTSAFLKSPRPIHIPAGGPSSPTLGCDPRAGTSATGSPPQPLKFQFRLLPPPDTGTHPGGDLIHRVTPRVSLGLGDSVEPGQVGTPLPGRGHPPATSAAAACRGPLGQPGSAALRDPQEEAKR